MVVLATPDLSSLRERYTRLPTYTHRVMVIEPDLDNEPTAFAVLGPDAGRSLSDLPLAMREAAMVA